MLNYMLDDEEIISSKKRKKKTLSDLLDKYGSVEGIDKNADVRDSYDYMFANTDNLIDEVMAERNASSEQNLPETNDDFEDIEVESKKTEIDIKDKYADIPKDSDGNPRYVFVEDLKTDGLTLTREKREEIKNLNTIDRFNEIKKLRKQQGVATPQTDTNSPNNLDVLNEKVNKANREIKVADNEYAGTRSDAEYSKEQKNDELKVDYSKYGKGFSKEFINKMLNDKVFQKALIRTKLNEGDYINHENDRGGETNMGITKKYYPDEDIKNLTRERATAILYRDYWLENKINPLPTEISDVVLDDAVVQGQPTAIRNLQKALKIEVDGIIGPKTINALRGIDYKKFKKAFSDEANAVEDEYQKNDPTQKVFETGHRNRYNNYSE